MKQLDVQGAPITVDARGCQKSVAEQVIKHKADSVLALEQNHPTLYHESSLWIDDQPGAVVCRRWKPSTRTMAAWKYAATA